MNLVRDSRWIASQLRERWDLLRGRLAVFMYHRVCEVDDHAFLQAAGVPHVSPGVFAEQMQFLADRGFRVFGFAEALERLEAGKSFPERSALITFDDGYRDNSVHAAPVLARHGFPATIFVATRVLEQRRLLWEHRVLWALESIPKRRLGELLSEFLPLAGRPPGAWIVLDPTGPTLTHKEALGRRIADEMRAAGVDEAQMARELYLSPADLPALLEAGVEIGSHGAAHHHLTSLSFDEKRADLAEAESCLASHLGENWLRVYCSPYGSHRAVDRELLVSRGYRAATSVRFGTNSHRTDPFFLRRVSLGDESWQRLRFLDRSAWAAAKIDARA